MLFLAKKEQYCVARIVLQLFLVRKISQQFIPIGLLAEVLDWIQPEFHLIFSNLFCNESFDLIDFFLCAPSIKKKMEFFHRIMFQILTFLEEAQLITR